MQMIAEVLWNTVQMPKRALKNEVMLRRMLKFVLKRSAAQECQQKFW